MVDDFWQIVPNDFNNCGGMGEEWVGGRGSSTCVAVATLRGSLGGGRKGLVKGAGFPLGVSSREGLPQFKQKLAPW